MELVKQSTENYKFHAALQVRRRGYKTRGVGVSRDLVLDKSHRGS